MRGLVMAAIGEKKSGGGGRQPTANTICYCPLEQDGTDATGNYTLTTIYSSDISFVANGYGQNVISKSSTGNYEVASCSVRAGTIGIWAKLNSTPVSDDNGTVISQGQHYAIVYDNGRGSDTGIVLRLEESDHTVHRSSHYKTDLTDWHLYIFTYDGTDAKLYVDGDLFDTISNPTNLETIDQINLLGIDSTRWSRGVKGDFSRALWEIPAWTDTEIQSYYNQFCEDYGKQKKRRPGANTIAYRPLNGDVNDYSGNNYNWTMSGGETYSTLTSGLKTLNFTGANYGEQSGICYPFSGNTPLKGPFTISMYIGNTTLRTSSYNSVGILIGKHNDFGVLYWTSSYSQSPNKIYVEMGVADRPESTIAQMPTQFPYSGYFHLLITMDENYQQTIYMNNIQVAQFTWGPTSINNVNGMRLGCDNNGGTISQDRRFIGNLSDIIIEDKIWSQQERTEYFNNTKALYGIS